MTDLDALKDALAEKQFGEETLAFAIMMYLNKSDPHAYEEILAIYNQSMDHKFQTLIHKNLSNHDTR